MKFMNAGCSTAFGCDPELFVLQKTARGRMAPVASEQIIPERGLGDSRYPSVVRDGVQVELHAGYGTGCRQSLASGIGIALLHLQDRIDALNKEKGTSFQLTFAPMVRLTKGDLSKISPEARQLNCKPSLNAYGREHIQRDGEKYLLRSGSGHLHLGTTMVKRVDPNQIVRILDLWLGIPSVLIARDPAEAIRRKTYGRAGEYRLPAHGLEYRTLSNFWLTNYKLESFVFGMARQALNISEGLIGPKHANKWATDALLGNSDPEAVERAINTSSFEEAMTIWKQTVRPVADTLMPAYSSMDEGKTARFEYFANAINDTALAKGTNGLERWFPSSDADILKGWLSRDTSIGWERFLETMTYKAPVTLAKAA